MGTRRRRESRWSAGHDRFVDCGARRSRRGAGGTQPDHPKELAASAAADRSGGPGSDVSGVGTRAASCRRTGPDAIASAGHRRKYTVRGRAGYGGRDWHLSWTDRVLLHCRFRTDDCREARRSALRGRNARRRCLRDTKHLMNIRIAHSPDSDDAFMFYGLATGKIPSLGYELDHVLSDIETLNRAAFEGKYEISAVSFHAYAHLTKKYILLPHGASMGDRYGPVVVARKDGPSSLKGVRVAIPGKLTTAFLALQLFDPTVEYLVMPFDEIQEKVHSGQVAAGLLIHEGQLTYSDEGLRKIVDLGEWWAERTGGLPLPLGGNVIRRDLGANAISTLSRLLHDSIAYGLEHRDEAVRYAMQFGRGIDRARTDQFVGMYVNGLTLEYGDRGREAVRRLLGDAQAAGWSPKPVTIEFAA